MDLELILNALVLGLISVFVLKGILLAIFVYLTCLVLRQIAIAVTNRQWNHEDTIYDFVARIIINNKFKLIAIVAILIVVSQLNVIS